VEVSKTFHQTSKGGSGGALGVYHPRAEIVIHSFGPRKVRVLLEGISRSTKLQEFGQVEVGWFVFLLHLPHEGRGKLQASATEAPV